MSLQVFLRKIWSCGSKSLTVCWSLSVYFRHWSNPAVSIGSDCTFSSWPLIRATDGGSIRLGNSVSLGRNVQLISQGGNLVVENNVHIGDGSIIVCREYIFLGADSLVAEYVVIRDQDHETRAHPIRLAGFRSSPVRVGRDVWVGSKASILRGVTIGDGAVIGAHTLVRNDIPAGMLAVGVPAKVVRALCGFD